MSLTTQTSSDAPFAVYVHWPFCLSKCPYCDFNSHVAERIDQTGWRDAYLAEIARIGAETKGRVLNSVFFGGGTRSLREPELVATILDAVRPPWTPANDIEFPPGAHPAPVAAGPL